MSTCLVTGGAGFMGSHVADELLSLGHDVVVLDDLSGGARENVPDGCVFVEGSVCEEETVEDVFGRHGVEYVYHLAAYAAEGLSHFIRRFNYENNVLGSMTLVNAAVRHEVRCFVFTSSIAVYGSGQLPFTEETEPRPEDPYGIAKYAVELDLRAAERLFGLPWVVFRPHNVYGPRQNIWDRYRNVIGIFMNRLGQGRPMPIFGDGAQTRAFTYIDDVAAPIAHSAFMAEAHGRVFNVGSDEPLSVAELAERVASVMGVEPEIEHLEAREEVKHALSTHDEAREVFGHLTRGVGIDEGLERMYEWARRTDGRPTPDMPVEVERNLPPSWR